MNYGLYLSASGVLTNMYRQDVFSNNLANVQTAGYKPDIPYVSQRPPEVLEDDLGGELSNELLDRLGGGVLAGPQRMNFSPGTLQRTNNPLDVALSDKHSFFVVSSEDADGGPAQTSLTRDGRFTIDAQGRLTTQGGDMVHGVGGGPIIIPPGGEVRITRDGRITRNGEELGQLRVAHVEDTQGLSKLGRNRFAMPRGQAIEPSADPHIQAGFIEGSGADPIGALMNIVSATKAATGNARMIQYHDLLMDRAVNTLGRVA